MSYFTTHISPSVASTSYLIKSGGFSSSYSQGYHLAQYRGERHVEYEVREGASWTVPLKVCPAGICSSYCVKGRAKSEPHRVTKEAEDEIIPTVAMDYMWMKSKEEKEKNAEEEDQELRGMPILVMKDSKSGCIDANVVPRKKSLLSTINFSLQAPLKRLCLQPAL